MIDVLTMNDIIATDLWPASTKQQSEHKKLNQTAISIRLDDFFVFNSII